MYLPDLLLLCGLILCLLLGVARGPGWLAALVGLGALGGAAFALITQAGDAGPAPAPWLQLGTFSVGLARRPDALGVGSALAALGGLALWLLVGLATRLRPGALAPAWGVAAALAAGLALLQLVLAADGVMLALAWLAAAPAIAAVNALAGAEEATLGPTERPARSSGGAVLLPSATRTTQHALSLGVMWLAGAGVLAAVLAAGRIDGAGYTLSDLPWSNLGTDVTLLLVGALAVQLGQWPLLGLTTGGAAISRAVLVPLPALYLILRLAELTGGAAATPAWATAWGVLAGLGAAGGLGAALAWSAHTSERRLALVTAAGWGLVVWGLGLATPAGRVAALVLAGATALGHLALDPRLGRWRMVGLASLGGLPLLAGFSGVWLLARALAAEGRPGLGLLVMLVPLVGAAALWPGLARTPLGAARAWGMGGLLAGGLLVLGLLPGSTALTAAQRVLGDPLPGDPLVATDWGLAWLGPSVAQGAWPVTALAAIIGGAWLIAAGVGWRRRNAPAAQPQGAWRLGDEALVPVSRALRLDRGPSAAPSAGPARSPFGHLAHCTAQGLTAFGGGLVAAEGPYYVLFTVLMLLLALLALTR